MNHPRSARAVNRASMAAAIGSFAGLLGVLLLTAGAATAAPDPCPNAEYRKGVSALLPDCRAYEQVSPTDKNGFDVESIGEYGGTRRGTVSWGAAGPATANGDAAAFTSPGAFASSPFGGVGRLQYLARRDGRNWHTRGITPRPTPSFVAVDVERFNLDMSKSLVQTNGALTADPIVGLGNYYLRDNETGSIDLLARVLEGGTFGTIAGVSRDLDHLVVATANALTAEPGQPATASKVYEIVDGRARLVSRQPGTGEPFQEDAFPGNQYEPSEGMVSDDGRHIFFRVGNMLYRRTDGTTTVLAAPSKRTSPDPIGPKTFQYATGDGNRLLFTSSERLTEDANTGTDLYRYDFAADELINLTAGTPGADDGGAQGVVDASEDARRVYFTATGALAPGAVAGQPNLYLRDDDGSADGVTRLVATLDATASASANGGETPVDERNWRWAPWKTAQATPDGSVLVFQSRAPLMGFDPRQAPGSSSCDYADAPSEGQPCSQVYVYDADADGGAGDLVCASCSSNGRPADYTYLPTLDEGLGTDRPRMVSDDGDRVSFTSPDALVSRDANGRYDTYIWERQSGPGAPLAGAVSLLSSGTSSDDSYAAGMSADGGDAFMRTRDRLVPQDGDTLADLYTARVGGGLVGQHTRPSPCEGDPCQGQPDRAPVGREVASAELTGPTNAALRGRARLRVMGFARAARVGRGGRIELRVRVTRPGRVRAAVRNRGRVVARGSARAAKAGTVTVRMRLSRGARRHLGRAGRLRVAVSVQATGARPRSLTLRLRGPRR